jgi:hypothetical protein
MQNRKIAFLSTPSLLRDRENAAEALHGVKIASNPATKVQLCNNNYA